MVSVCFRGRSETGLVGNDIKGIRLSFHSGGVGVNFKGREKKDRNHENLEGVLKERS